MIFAIKKPARDAADDFDKVSAGRKPKETRDDLAAIRSRIITAYADYDAAGGSPCIISPLKLEKHEVVSLQENYKGTFTGRVLQRLRVDAFKSTPNRVCPMCGYGQVAELDHYLPKDKYSEFSVLAFNLVPLCDSCNGNKSNLVGDASGRFFHVYYDDFSSSEKILSAKIDLVSRGVAVVFEVNSRLPQSLYLNASYQFDKLKLSERYIDATSRELSERAPIFLMHHRMFGPDGIKDFAFGQSKQFEKLYGKHHWGVALYDAIHKSEDFCNKGFQML